MNRTRPFFAAVVVVLVIQLLTSCGAGISEGPEYASASNEVSADKSRDDLINEEPREWSNYQVIDDKTIRVTFWTGTRSCYGNRIQVDESVDTVSISILNGTLPEATSTCRLDSREASMIVTTTSPIGDRKIIDGSAK